MNKDFCRYDYLVQAIEALSIYMDTCAADKNTLALINEAHTAIHELESIEKELRSTVTPEETPDKISTAMEQFHSKFANLAPVMSNVHRFLGDNKAAFKQIKDITRMILAIEETNKTLSKINTNIEKRVKAMVLIKENAIRRAA